MILSVLSRLETIVREAVDKKKTQVVNLLFYFLSNYGKRDLNYGIQTIGIPQDEVGDCSRILANFYLQEYDSKIYKFSTNKKSGYLRYSDDQIIAASSEKTAKDLMFQASKELTKLGLNLNASKAKFLTRTEFHMYWSFDIFKLLQDASDITKIEKAFDLFKQRIDQGVKFKPESVLRRLLSCDIKKLKKSRKDEVIKFLLAKNFLLSSNSYHFKKIYFLLDKNQKRDFLKLLNELSEEVLFNHFHLQVLKFVRECRIDRKKIDVVKKNLIKLRDSNP